MAYPIERNLDVGRLREIITYDPATGVLVWTGVARNTKAGALAGSPHNSGHWRVKIEGEEMLAHQLIWVWMTGRDAGSDIDHIDQDKLNNRWVNLRLATQRTNHENITGARRDSKSGIRGVSLCKQTGRWLAQITINGKAKNLGRYRTIEEAAEAYRSAKRAGHLGWVEA